MNTKAEYNIFLLWSTARSKENELRAVIADHFEIVKAYDIKWSKKYFAENLSRFYGKKLPSAKKKLKLCGEDSFLVLVVKDNQPNFSKDGKNCNMSSVKYELRQLLGNNYLHASDCQAEAEENLYFLLGKKLPQILQERSGKKPHKLQQDIIGVPTWLDEDKLSRAIKWLPDTTVDKKNRIISSGDLSLAKRVLNARKVCFTLKPDTYKISIRGRNVVFTLKQI